MVSDVTFNSNDPSSNPTEVYSFSKIFVFEKKEKEAVSGPFFKKWFYNIVPRDELSTQP